MLELILIRPGSTEFDEEGRIQGTLDVPLSETGNRQVEQAAEALSTRGIEMIYASPCQAAAETAEELAEKLGVRCKLVDKLGNLDHGLWQGMRLDEVKRKQPRVYKQWREHPETVCPPQGEMVEDARARLEAALAKIVKKHKQGVVALVLPDPLCTLAEAYLDRGLDQAAPCDLFQATLCGSWRVVTVGRPAPSSG